MSFLSILGIEGSFILDGIIGRAAQLVAKISADGETNI